MPKINKTKNNNLIRLIEYFFILVILFLTAINLNVSSKESKVLGAEIEDINLTNEKISYLENLINENPLYFNGYLELITLNIQESDFDKATEYFNIAKSINPNSQIIKSFGKTLNIK
ncbi:hypothetical protein KJ570_00445 [Patescibacteria group bacterium]|nr:hypothetical protein [Patescibacteria group bacterium]MBU2036209.1 hypothetical protein [Patescibacteria group bacterium]